MTLADTYRKLLADLERELAHIDRDLERESNRQAALVARRSEVIEGINGIERIIKERI